MDYITLFKEKFIESSEQYPQNDIGITEGIAEVKAAYRH